MFKNILLPVDLAAPESSMKALTVAVEICQSHGATLHVLCVVPGYSMSIVSQYFPPDFEAKTMADASKRLGSFIADNVPADITTQAVVANGSVYQEILRVAEEINSDLIVMASHRPELKDYLLGPNAARVVRHAASSVLVVRE